MPPGLEQLVAVVDQAIYVAGHRLMSPPTLDATYEMLRGQMGLGWIELCKPTPDEIQSVADEFGIHPLAVEDAVVAHQRPKLERYDDVLFTVLRPAHCILESMRIEFGEVHVFCGADFVVTIQHTDSPDLGRVRERLERHPELLLLGPEAVLYAVLDQVVDEYGPVTDALQNEIDEIESAIFDGDAAVPMRTHALFREVVLFQRATRPLLQVTQSLRIGFDKYKVDEELRRRLRDIDDHLQRVADEVDGYRALLQNILAVNAAVIGQQQTEAARRLTEVSIAQNDQVKRISAWAAILFAPTLVGTVYGMNFHAMPELEWRLGYPYAFALMALLCLILFFIFKRKEWL